MDSTNFERSLPALFRVQEKWTTGKRSTIPFILGDFIRFMTEVLKCYGATISRYECDPPCRKTSEIWPRGDFTVTVPEFTESEQSVTFKKSTEALTFPSYRKVLPSAQTFEKITMQTIEKTGEYEELDRYVDQTMRELSSGKPTLTTVTLQNITGSYRELGHLICDNETLDPLLVEHHRDDELISIYKEKDFGIVSALIYDILRDSPLPEDSRRVLHVRFIYTLISYYRSRETQKNKFKDALSDLLRTEESNASGVTYSDFFSIFGRCFPGLLRTGVFEFSVEGDALPLPQFLLETLSAALSLAPTINLEKFCDILTWRQSKKENPIGASILQKEIETIIDPVCGEGYIISRRYFEILQSKENPRIPQVVGLCVTKWHAAIADTLIDIVNLLHGVQHSPIINHRIIVADARALPWSQYISTESNTILVASDENEHAWIRADDGMAQDYTAADSLNLRIDELSQSKSVITSIV